MNRLCNFARALICSGLLLSTARTFAQCDNWHAGPLPGLDGANEGVYSIVQLGPRIVAAGKFNQALGAGAIANNIATWDGLQVAALGTGIDGQVAVLKSYNTTVGGILYYNLVAAGYFTAAGGVTANRVAIWTENAVSGFPPPAWTPLGAGFNNAAYALERFNNATFAAGDFTAAGGGAPLLSHIAQWNGSSWQSLGAGLNGACYVLKVYDGALYAGGEFTMANGTLNTGGLARWNGASWSLVGGTFLGIVYSLEVFNGDLIIGGSYPGLSGSPNIAKYNSNTGSYSTLGAGGADGPVFALLSEGGFLYAGGGFNYMGGQAVSRIARWNDSNWSAVRGGADYVVNGLCAFHNEVHAGGTFLNVGSPPVYAPSWARYYESNAPWVARQPFATEQPCGGNAAFTCVAADGYDPVSFNWTQNGALLINGVSSSGSTISGANTGTLSISNLSAADAGTFTCTVFNSCGSAASSGAALTVAAGAVPTINAQPASASACGGTAATFSVSASGGTLRYQWQVETALGTFASLGGSPVALPCGGTAYATAPTSNSTAIAVAGCAGDFNVRCLASNACGSTTSNSAALRVCNNAADLTCDGRVDLSDLSILLSNYGRGTTAAQGDLNGDHIINLSDLAIALSNYGAVCP